MRCHNTSGLVLEAPKGELGLKDCNGWIADLQTQVPLGIRHIGRTKPLRTAGSNTV